MTPRRYWHRKRRQANNRLDRSSSAALLLHATICVNRNVGRQTGSGWASLRSSRWVNPTWRVLDMTPRLAVALRSVVAAAMLESNQCYQHSFSNTKTHSLSVQ
jgi:hypothetical protein